MVGTAGEGESGALLLYQEADELESVAPIRRKAVRPVLRLTIGAEGKRDFELTGSLMTLVVLFCFSAIYVLETPHERRPWRL